VVVLRGAAPRVQTQRHPRDVPLSWAGGDGISGTRGRCRLRELAAGSVGGRSCGSGVPRLDAGAAGGCARFWQSRFDRRCLTARAARSAVEVDRGSPAPEAIVAVTTFCFVLARTALAMIH